MLEKCGSSSRPLLTRTTAEPTETITFTALSGNGYSLGSGTTATLNIINETATSLPSAKAAARFLIQAAFGPDQDSPGDADDIPENVEEVMAMGYAAWIDDQFTRPIGYYSTVGGLGGGERQRDPALRKLEGIFVVEPGHGRAEAAAG